MLEILQFRPAGFTAGLGSDDGLGLKTGAGRLAIFLGGRLLRLYGRFGSALPSGLVQQP